MRIWRARLRSGGTEMATYEVLPRFWNDYDRLSDAEKDLFDAARDAFNEDLDADRPPRSKLRVKPVQGAAGVWELTWNWPDGRATFSYGDEKRAGKKHVIWRRCGGHEIFKKPYGTEASGAT